MLLLIFRNTIAGILIFTLVLSLACAKKEPKIIAQADWGKIVANPSREDNQKNRDLWKNKNINHYRYKAKISCDCGLVTYNKNFIDFERRAAKGVGWVIVEVNNNQVTQVTNIDGTPNPDFVEMLKIHARDVIAIAFEWIELGVKYEFNPRIAIYDANYGFPHYTEIFPSEKGPTDIGSSIEIIEFEVLPAINGKANQE